MTLTLMKNYSDNRVLNKNVVTVVTKDCNVYNDCNIMNPVLLLTYSAEVVDCNYAYIPDWNKYYYVSPPLLINGGRCILSLSEDALMSHADEIKSLSCTILRNEFGTYSLLPDSNVMIQGENEITEYSFNNPFQFYNRGSYVLQALGGS